MSMNKYQTSNLSNRKLVQPKDGKERRQQVRLGIRRQRGEELQRRFAGTGRGGNPQWPEELCPRSRRRSIVRDGAKQLWAKLYRATK